MAIAHELKRQDPYCKIYYVGEHGGKFAHLIKNQTSIDEVHTIFAGKFRRYHKEAWIIRLLDFKTNFLNARDLLYVIIGILQSFILIKRINPDIIFLKGGYVGLPIGIAASATGKPFITHDSDAIPSLSNRLVARWAKYNATGLPGGLYSYPKKKIKFVGIPLATEYEGSTPGLVKTYRKEIGIDADKQLLLIIGGSLGAKQLNRIVVRVMPELLDRFPKLVVVHQVGKGNSGIYKDIIKSKRLMVFEFIPDSYRYTGAADMVITRGGATSIAELAVQGRAAIIIPNPLLTAGHQEKNAQELGSKNLAIVLEEKDLKANPEIILERVSDLLKNPKKRKELSDKIKKIGSAEAAKNIAQLLLSRSN